MAELKATEVKRFLEHPPASANLILVFGPDTGLVSERAGLLAKTVLGKTDDPFALVRLDGSDIASDPNRLADEAFTISMFGGKRVIHIKSLSGKNIAKAVEPLVTTPPDDAVVIIEGGDMKKTAPLRKLIGSAKNGAAIPCFADSARDLDDLINTIMSEANLSISNDARDLLKASLGSDRLASRGEIEKLTLFAHGQTTITEDDVRAIVGDASAFQIDEIIDATAVGNAKEAERKFRQYVGSGLSAHVIITAMIRHFQMLHQILRAQEKGVSAQAAVDGMRPPIFFKRKPLIVRQSERWSRQTLERAMARIDETALQTRLNAPLGTALIADLILTLSIIARRGRM
ncbi:DNA polymerase III subunit delta [Coralliovum pocilloporae]|uniref:DNA polymerase III subunit delta n=1 Tax=Coralliovum pocilloporae TaxID=3066369 RepID=UPI003307A297